MLKSPTIEVNLPFSGDFMQPKPQILDQGDLFRSRLDQMLDRQHELFRLADQIDWSFFEREFGPLYSVKMGRPGVPIRLLVGLHYLKHAFNESDESVVARFVENPYWQYFCGFEFFQHRFPLDPTTLVKWRKRIGSKGTEKLLQATIVTAVHREHITPKSLERVNVDTTVQEKAVAYPTDARLYYKARLALVKLAKERGIALRQSYERLGKKAYIKHGRYKHARQMNRAKRELKRLKTYLGCVLRDIGRKVPTPDQTLATLLERSTRIFNQKQHDKNKLYSLHAPEVSCIAKGKSHKKYEFGCKVSVVSTSHDNWIIGTQAKDGNPYDGHTLKEALKQAAHLTGTKPGNAYCDKGYKGAPKELDGTTIHLANKRKSSMNPREWAWYKRRSAIEPIIGHLKSDHRMDRNHLKGAEGDKINAILAACGYNLRKLLKLLLFWLLKERAFFAWGRPYPLQINTA